MDQMGQRRFGPLRPEGDIIESGRTPVELVGIDDAPMKKASGIWGQPHGEQARCEQPPGQRHIAISSFFFFLIFFFFFFFFYFFTFLFVVFFTFLFCSTFFYTSFFCGYVLVFFSFSFIL